VDFLAVGDIVAILSAQNTILNYQPAASVETMLSSFFGDSGTETIALTDGVESTYLRIDVTWWQAQTDNMKVFVNNTHYVTVLALGAGRVAGLTGMQIK
jgi:hypothetical protein